jgi:hypothetical protein
MRLGVSALLLSLAAALPAAPASAAEARVRVRGSSRIEASVGPSERGTEVKGAVTDDTGRPVASAKVQVRWAAPSGSALVLPPHEGCGSGTATREAPNYAGPAGEITLEADTWGRFCVHFPLELPDGQLLIGYVDSRGLLDGTNIAVNLVPASDIEIRFAPPPETISADRDETTILLETRARRLAEARGPEALVVSWHAEDSIPVVLGRRQVKAGELVRFSFSTAALKAPGVGELRAVLGDGQQSAEARARVLVTTTARLVTTTTTTEANADGNTELELRVVSRLGPVTSGSIEARSDGRTVGIAPVAEGQAALALRLGPGARQVDVRLRYLSSTPWWLAGPEHQLAVSVARESPLRRLPWAIMLLALVAWIGLAWRRPRPSARAAPRRNATTQRAPAAAVVWQPAEDKTAGWSGRVIDAHDQAPIAGARVDFQFGQEVVSVSTDAEGHFRLDAGHSAGSSTLVVSAPWHSRLERVLPPPGRLGIALVTRRRALLARLIHLATGLRVARAASAASAGVAGMASVTRESVEPTPDELARHAADNARGDLAVWARAVEGAVYGPDPVDAEREAQVSALEPRED